jgi:hypothetical protein
MRSPEKPFQRPDQTYDIASMSFLLRSVIAHVVIAISQIVVSLLFKVMLK